MKILMTILASLGLAAGSTGYENVSVKEFSKIITQNNLQILDVRTPEEYAEGHFEVLPKTKETHANFFIQR